MTGPGGEDQAATGGGRVAALALIGCCLLFVVPAFFVADAFTGDAQIQWRWQYYFAPQFWGGDWWPRWLLAHNAGFGSPAFFLYAPSVQWLASLTAPLLPAADQIPARFVIAIFILLLGGAIGAYRWAKALTGKADAALFGALLYTLLPYHAYVNVYQRGAFAELAAMTVLPWVFYGAERIRATRRPSATAIVALALYAVSHAPSTLMLAPILGGYVILAVAYRPSAGLAVAFAWSGFVAGLLAAAYLLPALVLSEAINTRSLFGPYFYPWRWLVGGPRWPDSGTELVIGAVSLFYALVTLASFWLVRRHGDPHARRQGAVLFAAILAIGLLISAPAAPLWAAGTILNKIQFPWRFLSIATLFVAGLGAVGFAAVGAWQGKRACAVLVGTTLALFVVNAGFLAARVTKARIEHRHPPGIVETLADTRDQKEYRLGDLDRLADVFGARRTLAWPSGPAPAIVRWAPRAIELRTAFDRPRIVAIHQLQFTGWDVTVSGVPAGKSRRLAPGLDVAATVVPAGVHRVDFRLAPTAAELWGARLSLTGLVLLIATLAAGRRLGRPAVRRTGPGKRD